MSSRLRLMGLFFALVLILNVAQARELTFWGPGYLGDARAVAVAPNGEVWAGCSGKIAIFRKDGAFLREITGLDQVNSIIFTDKGVPIYAANGGQFSVLYGDKPYTVGGFRQYAPWEVVQDEKGFVYATDGGNGVIKKYDITGSLPNLVTTYKAPDTDAMDRPFSVTLDAQNRLYVSDERKPGLWIFANDGKFLRRILTDTQCWRVRTRPDGIYVVTNQNITVIKQETGDIVRTIKTFAGQHDAMGFAIDADGNLYFGGFYKGTVIKTTPDGSKVLLTFGPSYRATLTLPDAFTPGTALDLPLKVEAIASKPLGTVPPTFSLKLQPAALPGEQDSNFANAQGTGPSPEWEKQRQQQYAAQEIKLQVKQEESKLQISVPADTPSNIYRLLVHADHQAEGGVTDGQVAVRAVLPGPASNLTLFVPRQRSVFQQGEQIEISVILRSKDPLPAGTLKFSLITRQGESLAYQENALLWKQFTLPEIRQQTLTFRTNASGISPGRYLLQAEYASDGRTLRDTWPLQIVTTVQPTNFRILFPEWSAGYTDIWGIFTGKGMRADAAGVAKEGILLYDTTIGGRNQNPSLQPVGADAGQVPALMAQAAADPALPAPEHFMLASPLEIELQEALRNGMTVQRDIWGSHMLANWGMADPLGMPRDNRVAQLWTQWQREWPSWIGHRYLTLSIDEGDNPERMALKERLKMQGTEVPGEQELQWLRNGPQRQYISDAPSPVTQEIAGIGADAAGNVYTAARGGVLLKYNPDGKLERKGQLPGEVIDIAVAKDGTVYGAHMGQRVSVTAPDGKTTSWGTPGFSSHSPRGICIDLDGTLLVSDEDNGKVVRYSTDGKELGVFADKRNLQRPAGSTVLPDGTVAVLDGGRGGTMLFKADGTPLNFLPGVGSHSAGGKGDVCAAPDGTLWATQGWGSVNHYDRDGKQLGYIGHNTFAPGGMSLPMSVAMHPNGNVLVSDVALPFAQELTVKGDPIHLFGLGTLLADVRLDRQRYTWADRIIATVWMAVPGQEGDLKSTLQAFARPGDGAWAPLAVTPFSAGDYGLAVPKLTGQVMVRLVWAPPGAGPDHPLHADYTIQVNDKETPQDSLRAFDIITRELEWKRLWTQTRMGTLTRWTQLSNRIRPGTQNTAPTNYGTPDSLAEGVWVPWRRDAVVAECENVGHDHGDFPLMGPWYISRALEGPQARPVWSSLLQWYWRDGSFQRPLRDTVVLLGAGASGIGTGTLVTRMDEKQLAVHRTIVDRLRRLGEATMALELPGKGGVAVLHSFTQESMDPYMEEHFYTAHAAWYDLLRAHVPTAVVSEESIAADGLLNRYKAVLLPGIQYPLPDATMAGLERFRKAGGEIWIDLGTRIDVPGAKLVRTRYRAFWAQDAYYWMHGGYGVGGYDGNYEYWRMKQGSDQRLPAIREAFGKYAQIPINTDDPNVFLQERRGGQAVYVFAGNDHYPDKPLYQTHLASQTPVPATANFTLKGGAIYDALAMKRITSPTLAVNYTDQEPGSIWAVLPKPIGGVALKAALNAGTFYVTAQVNDAAGVAIPAVVPLELTVTDAAGNEQYHLWRSTDASGACRLNVPVAWMAPQGAWTVTARELLSGLAATPVKVSVGAMPAATITQDTATALVFDAKAIRDWMGLLPGNEVWIGLDKDQVNLRADADSLVQGLAQKGIRAKVVQIDQLPEIGVQLDYNMSPDAKVALAQVKAGEKVGRRVDTESFKVNGPQRIIMRPLILLGNPAQNRWLADIEGFKLARRQLSPSYPGPGRALVQFVWAPFYDGYNAVTISATDADGVREGIKALLGL